MDFEVLSKASGAYAVLLTVIGTIGNSFALIVCLRKDLRKTPTFIFSAFSLVADILSLYFWNIDSFLQSFFNTQVVFMSIPTCIISVMLQCFSLEWSALLSCMLSIETYLSIKIKNWRNIYFKPIRAVIVSIITAIILFVFNLSLSVLIKNDFENKQNITCFESKYANILAQVNTMIYGFISYAILLISNILVSKTVLCNTERSINRSDQSMSRRRSMSITVLLVTTTFMLLTMPFNIMNAFFLQTLYVDPNAYAKIFLIDSITFTYHGFHFAILALTNKQFRKESKSLIFKIINKGNNRVSVTINTNLTVN